MYVSNIHIYNINSTYIFKKNEKSYKEKIHIDKMEANEREVKS